MADTCDLGCLPSLLSSSFKVVILYLVDNAKLSLLFRYEYIKSLGCRL